VAVELGATFRTGLDWALDLHATQTRKKSEVPYAAHLLAVSAIALEAGGDEIEATAALLHDAIEDTDDADEPLTREAFVTRFGASAGGAIHAIVDACSDRAPGAEPSEQRDASTWVDRKTAYLDELQGTDVPRSVLLVSASDKLANVRSTFSDLAAGRGLAVWDTSNAPEPKRAWQLWYHRSLAEAFRTRLDGPLPGLLSDAVSELARAADVLDERSDDDVTPQYLECRIGGFGTGASIVLDGTELVHDDTDFGEVHGTARTIPGDDDWRRFFGALDAIGAWHWAGDYSVRHEVMDGTWWSITILRDGRLLRAGGSNGYPPTGDGPDTSPEFDQLCAALEQLTGATFR
jgi:hypothetical protein